MSRMEIICYILVALLLVYAITAQVVFIVQGMHYSGEADNSAIMTNSLKARLDGIDRQLTKIERLQKNFTQTEQILATVEDDGLLKIKIGDPGEHGANGKAGGKGDRGDQGEKGATGKINELDYAKLYTIQEKNVLLASYQFDGLAKSPINVKTLGKVPDTAKVLVIQILIVSMGEATTEKQPIQMLITNTFGGTTHNYYSWLMLQPTGKGVGGASQAIDTLFMPYDPAKSEITVNVPSLTNPKGSYVNVYLFGYINDLIPKQ